MMQGEAAECNGGEQPDNIGLFEFRGEVLNDKTSMLQALLRARSQYAAALMRVSFGA